MLEQHTATRLGTPYQHNLRLSLIKSQPTLQITEQDFDKCFNVNVKGVYFGVHSVLPVFLEQNQGGSIINIASVGATRPRPGLVWYNSSKGAVTNVRQHFLFVGEPLMACILGDERSCSRIWTAKNPSELGLSSPRRYSIVSADYAATPFAC